MQDYFEKNRVECFKLRWFTENCTEIRLPSGKTIVIDPFLLKTEADAATPMDKGFVSGYGAEDLEGCDYVIISHVHGDHIGSLKEVYDRFQPAILVNGWSAFPLAKVLDLPLGSIIPMTDGNHYDLVDFEIDWIQGRHSPASGAMSPSKRMERMGTSQSLEEVELGMMGTIYNSNFVIDLKNGFKIGVDGGRYEPELLKIEQFRPNLIFGHSTKFPEINAQNYAQCLMRSGGQYLMAFASQNQKDGNDKTIAMTNAILEEKGYSGRAINPKPGQWISFTLGAAAV